MVVLVLLGISSLLENFSLSLVDVILYGMHLVDIYVSPIEPLVFVDLAPPPCSTCKIDLMVIGPNICKTTQKVS
jgi:hypothetical protein